MYLTLEPDTPFPTLKKIYVQGFMFIPFNFILLVLNY